jgi:hypothetical protein
MRKQEEEPEEEEGGESQEDEHDVARWVRQPIANTCKYL